MIFDAVTDLDSLKAMLTERRKPSNAMTAGFKLMDGDAYLTILDAIDFLSHSNADVMKESIDADMALAGTGQTEFVSSTGYFDAVNLQWRDDGSPGWTVDRWKELGAKLLVTGTTYTIEGNMAGALAVSTTSLPTSSTAYKIVVMEAPLLDYLLRSYGVLYPSFATADQKRQLLKQAYVYDESTERLTGWLALKNTVNGWSTYLNILSTVAVAVNQKHSKGRQKFYGLRGFGYPNQTDVNDAGTDDDAVSYFYSPSRDAKEIAVTITGSVTDAFKEFVEQSAVHFVPMADAGEVRITFVYN